MNKFSGLFLTIVIQAQEYISSALQLDKGNLKNTLKLLDEGATIPFIARYRKEKTGGLNEVVLLQIEDAYKQFKELEKRKSFVLDKIKEKKGLTADLQSKIETCTDLESLEDLYLPFKDKKSTLAQNARAMGLEPLAHILYKQREFDIYHRAREFVKGPVKNTDEAVQGAMHIVAEWISENASVRSVLRAQFEQHALLESHVKKGKESIKEAQVYKDYFKHAEKMKHAPSHRIMAMLRGEKEGFLSLDIEPDREKAIQQIWHLCVLKRNNCGKLVETAAEDAYKRLIKPQLETEFKKKLKDKADAAAVQVFATNLQQLLLAPPFGNKAVLAIDPGIRTGCKWVSLNAFGELLDKGTIFPDREPEKANKALLDQIVKHQIEGIAVGNGTAGRQTEVFVRKNIDSLSDKPSVFLENEDGASIYSASEIAREEFPELDLVYRGAISIGRRLQDPLSELVKIDPRSLGIGQYQHDINPALLREKLHETVVHCVNKIGVNVNRASRHILQFISGLGPQTAANIVAYRHQNGGIKTREELKQIPRLGAKVFEQCAGFLRITEGNELLDRTGIHPESYGVVKSMARYLNTNVNQLQKNPALLYSLNLEQFANDQTGLPTLENIVAELTNPGLDIRQPRKQFRFDERIKTIEDIKTGMKLAGIVSNITAFGVFVDLGIKDKGLIHISKLSHQRISTPDEVVSLQQEVYPRVIELDIARKRIALSLVDS